MHGDMSGSRHEANGPAPPRYRAVLQRPAGAVTAVHALTASDDAEAVTIAEGLVDGHAVDLWHGLRFIEHFPALEPPPDTRPDPEVPCANGSGPS